jgi:hypothetical protein
MLTLNAAKYIIHAIFQTRPLFGVDSSFVQIVDAESHDLVPMFIFPSATGELDETALSS